jgi:SAM-dependent methyltransferase
VKGVDYSDFGIKQHNKALIDEFIAGDIYENLTVLYHKKEQFNLIWLDNVLEHVLDPLDLLNRCYGLCRNKGYLIIEVPNDFSSTQRELKKQEFIKEDYWIAVPDHISYFNREGLINLAKDARWQHVKTISDFPIEFNLFNPNANYKNDHSKGKGAHIQRMKIENMLHGISIDKTNHLYEIMADLGLGRQITGIFKKQNF